MDLEEQEKSPVSYPTIFVLIITSLLFAWWNYASLCTPTESFQNFIPKSNFKKALFPLVKIYYLVLCIFFFLFPMYLFLQALILLKKKINV